MIHCILMTNFLPPIPITVNVILKFLPHAHCSADLLFIRSVGQPFPTSDVTPNIAMALCDVITLLSQEHDCCVAVLTPRGVIYFLCSFCIIKAHIKRGLYVFDPIIVESSIQYRLYMKLTTIYISLFFFCCFFFVYLMK